MSPETLQLLTWLIPVPPLASFFLIVLFTNRSKALSHTIALVSILASLALSWAVFFNVINVPNFGKEGTEITSAYQWFNVGAAETFNMGVLVDPLTAVMLFFVPLACTMIFLYSVGYHNFGKKRDPHDKPGWPAHNGVEPLYSRFFAYLSLFAFGMLVLCVADNLLLLFIGWEIMGLCSFLLIGFWFARKYDDPNQITPRQAAVKAFMTTRVADVIMLLGIVYLYTQTGTLSFREIFIANEGALLKQLAETPSVLGGGLAAAHLIAILLLIGTIGKSAQFPLHTWLPDAMEGPTPVSAMIHAAAMVSAGVYAMIRVYPLFEVPAYLAEAGHGPTPAMWVMAGVGAFTALFAAMIAVVQNDVKKVLAYSTISQLGFMLAALGIGGYVAATFHLMTHAFFKALLFLGSGSIIHGVEHGMHHSHEHLDPQDMRNMGGLREKMPMTFWAFLIGGMALAGFPLITAGFWSKDEILLDAWANQHYVIFGMLAVAALLTTLYITRSIVMVFGGKPRTQAAAHAHESVWTMTLPLGILSFFALTAGWVNIPEDFPVLGELAKSLGADFAFKKFLAGTLLEKPEALTFDPVPLVTSFVVAIGGIVLGWLVYRNAYATADAKDPLERFGTLHRWLKNKFYIDELYDSLFVQPTFALAKYVFPAIDRGIIDGILHLIGNVSLGLGNVVKDYIDVPVVNGTNDKSGEAVKRWGQNLRLIQTGRVQQYLLMTMAMVVVMTAFVLWFAQ